MTSMSTPLPRGAADRRELAAADEAGRPDAVRTAWRIAKLLDETFTVPGTDLRVGIDGLIGLIPGIGDALGAALSSSVLFIAARAGVSTSVLLRMAGNVLVELAVGAIPVVGDLFDFAWKANRKNAELLERAMDDPKRAGRNSTALLAGVGVGVLAAAGGVVYALFALLEALIDLLA